MSTLPPLAPLASFRAAARHQSFTNAAHELHVTHGAVSKAVKQLEEHFGFPLFHRRSRGLRLTERGARLARHVEAMFADLEKTCEALRDTGRRRRLSVSCEPTLAMRWLMPRLEGFHEAVPGTDIHLSTGGGPIDLGTEGAHLAIRRSDFAWPARYWHRPLGREAIGPVCSPGYLDAHAHGAHTLLHTRSRPGAWADWRALAGVDVQADAEHFYNHFYFCLQAAGAGLGLAMGPEPLVRDAVAQGLLVAPFGFADSTVEYVVLAQEPPREGGRAQAFIHWLADELALPGG